jgi:hypothetical protein
VHSASIKRENFVPEVEIEHRGHGMSIAYDGNNIRARREFFTQDPKIRLGEDRCPKVVDAL